VKIAPAASAPSSAVTPSRGVPIAKKMPEKPPEPVPDKPYRLRMRVSVSRTTDLVSGGLGNTDDEVYYGVAMQRDKAGALPKMEIIHRASVPDIWEMGAHTQKHFDRILFQGKLPPAEATAFTVVIAEQDNKELAGIAMVLSATATLIKHMVDGRFSKESNADKLSEQLNGQTKALVDRIAAQDDEIIGLIGVTMKDGRLDVDVDPKVFSRTVESSPTSPLMELNGALGLYRVQLFAEDPTAVEPPKDRIALVVEEDNCGGDLWVDTKNGKKQIPKNGRTEFRPPFYKWKWWCDGTEESTTANPKTTLVDATRDPEGREILWRTYMEAPLSADLKP
jgi:hypothetical protein